MPTKDELIRENHELRARLEFAQVWMRREVATSITRIQEEQSHKNTRIAIKNIFETEWLDILTRKMIQRFDGALVKAPKYTLERLIDAEIYWNTLQQYPQMDALPIVIAYQKILDSWIEDWLVIPWRIQHTQKRYQKSESPLEQDIINLVEKKYTLSLGRFYQLLDSIHDVGVVSNESIRELTCLTPTVRDFLLLWEEKHPNILNTLISDAFFLPFQELMKREVFSRKRHESKVAYSDAQCTRDILMGVNEKQGLFEILFR